MYNRLLFIGIQRIIYMLINNFLKQNILLKKKHYSANLSETWIREVSHIWNTYCVH